MGSKGNSRGRRYFNDPALRGKAYSPEDIQNYRKQSSNFYMENGILKRRDDNEVKLNSLEIKLMAWILFMTNPRNWPVVGNILGKYKPAEGETIPEYAKTGADKAEDEVRKMQNA